MDDLRLGFVVDEDSGIVGITKVNYVPLGRDEEVVFPESLVVGVWEEEGEGLGILGLGGRFLEESVKRFLDGDRKAGADGSIDRYEAEELGSGDSPPLEESLSAHPTAEQKPKQEKKRENIIQLPDDSNQGLGFAAKTASQLIKQIHSFQREFEKFFEPANRSLPKPPPRIQVFPGLIATGPGVGEIPTPPSHQQKSKLTLKPIYPPISPPHIHYRNIYIPPQDTLTSTHPSQSPAHACPPTVLTDIPPDTEVLILLRGGGCKFSDKLKSIPSHLSLSRLKLVIFVDNETTGELTRPLFDEPQSWIEQGGKGKGGGKAVGVVMARGAELVEGVFGGSISRGNGRKRRRK
ncbi:hypothetical protein BGX38DRAFT_1147432 [Terfezia claveryi]|nr:hypothetical protein BGX38DRAFT_1147432 [Terfezia claveryi]